jgi:sulfate transport system ATP-binding protein
MTAFMGIRVEGVSKRFGDFVAIDQVDLAVASGSLTALLGPSGSGKSTLLRLIAGLETPDRGRIFLTGEDATERDVRERNIGFVFQHYALFKHMTVAENIAFGLSIRRAPRAHIQAKVHELLELVQLQGLGKRYPSQLSGGQRQRVALARALAVEPKVLLLDEPFGALDAKVRKDLRAWLRRLHDEVHVTTVFVTHDQEEAMEVSDQVVIMHRGRIEQMGTPAEIYDHPASSFVMSFIGPVNVLNHAKTEPVYIRPRDIWVQREANGTTQPARIQRLIHLGWEVQLELATEDGQMLMAHLTRERFDELQLAPQERVHIKPLDARSFPLNYSI